MSLIELVAALVLSALLMASVLGLATHLASAQSALESRYEFHPWTSRIESLINADFRNSRGITFSPQDSTISFLGCHSMHTSVDGSSQHLCYISYHIESFQERNFLIRTEQSMIGNQPIRHQPTIVCQGVRALFLQTRLDSDISPPLVRLDLIYDDGSHAQLFLTRHGGI